ncbi:MAG: LAGLIDADG family homing endonuclease [Candidatus Omnitrophica bacterium]|nr:LAGLIDADG family homing endonuclease [Candidatus Omnitrophota bacterium]MDD5237504.1 LAGLIDADG family homing endonuclease [Candidatus Omnitrophota bacterium]
MLYKWTPELAYIVGLITTDGSLSKDKRHIDFTSNDLQLLKTFKKCLSLRNKISKKFSSHKSARKSYHLQFSDVKFYNWLLTIGLMPNKTYHLGKIKIPKLYFRDFLRGYLDGDGSIFTYTDKYMSYKGKHYKYNRIYTALNSASHKNLSWIKDILRKELNITGAFNSWLKNEKCVPAWTLRFAKKESLQILPWIYYRSNLPCLIRKRRVAEKFLTKCL